MKYVCTVGSHITIFVNRKITVNADNPDKAEEKAIEKFKNYCNGYYTCVDTGSPRVDSISKEGLYNGFFISGPWKACG